MSSFRDVTVLSYPIMDMDIYSYIICSTSYYHMSQGLKNASENFDDRIMYKPFDP